jgi:hypothetical protein
MRPDEDEPLVGGVDAHHPRLAVRGAHLPLERLGAHPEALGRAAREFAGRDALRGHAALDLVDDLRHPYPRHPADVHRALHASPPAVVDESSGGCACLTSIRREHPFAAHTGG